MPASAAMRVLICGGGIAGLTLADCLERQGMSPLIVEGDHAEDGFRERTTGAPRRRGACRSKSSTHSVTIPPRVSLLKFANRVNAGQGTALSAVEAYRAAIPSAMRQPGRIAAAPALTNNAAPAR